MTLVMGAMAADFFFIAPRWTLPVLDFWTYDREHQITLGLYIFVGAVTIILSESLHAARRRAEAARAAVEVSEERFRTVADFTCDWEYWTAPDGSFVYVSPSCQRVTGYSADEFLADPHLLEQITFSEDREKVVRHHQEARQKSEPLGMEFRLVARDGQIRWIEHICQVVYNEQGKRLGRRASNRETTERKQAEQELYLAQQELLDHQQRQREQVEAQLAEAKEQLVRQARLATIGQVSASIAHDLRNPLSVVRNATYLLRRRGAEQPSGGGEYLAMIERELDTISRIITNLTEAVHAKQPQKEMVDLGEAAREVFDRLEHGNRVSCDVECRPQPLAVAADPVQLRQVLGNLLANAIQAMPQGGQVRVRGRREGGFDTITVEDDGPGIPPEARPRIFEPLFTTRPKGTGLGLAICRQIIQQHGGTIELLDSDGPGAAFQIRLPSPGAERGTVTVSGT